MKKFIFFLCILTTIIFVNHAEAFYNCIDSSGNSIITDNPPSDAICKSPGSDDKSATGTSNNDMIQIITTLNYLEHKASQSALTKSESHQQVQLLEDLHRLDPDSADQRIIKTLESLESKSIAGGLTAIEREQQTRLLQLQRSFNKKSDANAQDEAESATTEQDADIGVQNDEQKAKQTQQKNEMKRLLKIPRLSY